MRMGKRELAEKRGHFAETIAAWMLRLKGYRILENRCKTPVGEIDLIAKRGKTIAFIEVKARQKKSQAYEALRPQQLSRITRAAELYLSKNPRYGGYDLRFDAILLVPKCLPIHLVNAW